MFKKITLTIVILIMAMVNIRGQANWSFVGPYSTNQENNGEGYANKFETSQMTNVVTLPQNPNFVVATSRFAGLWYTPNGGDFWYNIDLSPTGLTSAFALAVKNSNEILVGNYHNMPSRSKGSGYNYCYSTKVSSYNFNTLSWYHYPALPQPTGRFIIRCIAVHPTNQNIIYAGTTKGLYRYDGLAWNLILPNSYIESIVFIDNSTCYVSGSDQAANYSDGYPQGKALVYVSTDLGNSIFQNFAPNVINGLGSHLIKSHVEICKSNNNTIYALCSAYNTSNTEQRSIHKIIKTGSTFSHDWTSISSDPNSSPDRMAIAIDNTNNRLWYGGVNLQYLDLLQWGIHTGSNIYNSTQMSNGLVHNDIHCLHVDGNNNLWVACDGGIGRASLNTSTAYFYGRNRNLNVALINGFSGSELNPNIYAFGGQDITTQDIYDASQQRNIYTHTGGNENDGALIYKYDGNIIFMDESSYTNNTRLSENGGSAYSTVGSYLPNPNPPFSASSQIESSNSFEFAHQRTIQDPFRPNRVFQTGRRGRTGFSQFDFTSKKMVVKMEFSNANLPSSTYLNENAILTDMSFSPTSKNSLYLITGNYWPTNSPSTIFKYVGPDIDDCWIGHNQYYSGSTLQWQEIAPNYSTFSSIGGGAVNIPSNKWGQIVLKKVETSSWDPKTIYVAGLFAEEGDVNFNNVKVIKYNGTSWTNYSSGLPLDAIVNTMVMDHYSNDALYLSTDMGVYYRNATMNQWEPYTTGFNQSNVKQMEINYKENTVRVGTYGRGIWKSQLKCPTTQNMNMTFVTAPGVYEATTIVSVADNALVGTVPVVLRGTNSVSFLPGFKATPGLSSNQYLLALIHGCSPGSSTSPSMYRSSELPYSNALNEESYKDPLVLVYPNPTHDKFTVSLNPNDELPQSISVRSVLGNEVKKINSVTDRNLTIDLSDCSDGVYIVNVNYADKTLTNKIVKTSGR